jgi:hypothetical protein
LLKLGRLKQIDIFPDVVPDPAAGETLGEATLQLRPSAVHFGRNCGASLVGAALLVGERGDPGDRSSSPPLTRKLKSPNLRAFDYANLCALDPELRHEWKLSWQGATLKVVFR